MSAECNTYYLNRVSTQYTFLKKYTLNMLKVINAYMHYRMSYVSLCCVNVLTEIQVGTFPTYIRTGDSNKSKQYKKDNFA